MDIKALRQKILDLAIRGKLVPQDPNDEPASVLLERIRAEKQQMVKDGKLKPKDIKNNTIIFVGEDNLHYEKFQDGTVKCIEDEIPFELPEGWEWCRVRDIAAVKGGKRLPKGVGFSPCRTAHAYIRVTDMKNHCINTDDLKYISEEVFLQIKNYTISKDDLYVTIAGTIGVTGEVPTELDGMNLTENAVKITNIQINKNYLCLIIQSEFVQQQFQDKTHQVAMPKLALERILSTLIPVCTITTQSAMVSKFVEMDSLINQIREEKEILAETVSLTKSKILDLAIRGKLVPQNPDDEPASVLLERIRAEKEELIKAGKIKRDKKESIIFKGDDNSYYEKIGDSVACIDAELPFEIPDNWCWARLNCISINYDSYRKPINSYDRKNRVLGKSKDELYPYYGATGQIGFIDDFLFNGEYILLGEDAAPFLDKKAQKAYMIKGKSWVNNHAHILQSLVFPEYLTNCLNSIDYFDYVYGTTRLKLTQENMNRILVPVPSIEEQCKIAQAINNLFVLIESIKASLS